MEWYVLSMSVVLYGPLIKLSILTMINHCKQTGRLGQSCRRGGLGVSRVTTSTRIGQYTYHCLGCCRYVLPEGVDLADASVVFLPQVIRNLLVDGENTLVLMPTGGGKVGFLLE